MEEVPRCTSLVPLAFPCFVLCLIGVEKEWLLDYQGRAGIISIVALKVSSIPEFGAEEKSALLQDFLLLSAVSRLRG